MELKSGETYNGRLVSCDAWMNINLRDVVCTSPDGDQFWKLATCYIRGSAVKYLRLPPDLLEKAEAEEKQQQQEHHYNSRGGGGGRGRGRSGSGGQGRGRGRGRDGGRGREGREGGRGSGRGREAKPQRNAK